MESVVNEASQPWFWLAIGKVFWVDALLSGDNAIVIAVACSGLPKNQRFWGIILGAAAAIITRIAFTGFIAQLMTVPYLREAGALALIYVAVKMCIPDDGEPDMIMASTLYSAIFIIVAADMVMSLDNMIAVAAVAKGSLLILSLGLMISIPMIVLGATALTLVLTKFPVLIWAGAGLLGWIAGGLVGDGNIMFELTGVTIVLALVLNWSSIRWILAKLHS